MFRCKWKHGDEVIFHSIAIEPWSKGLGNKIGDGYDIQVLN